MQDRKIFMNRSGLPNLADQLQLIEGWLNEYAEGLLYCPGCGAERRASVKLLLGGPPLGHNWRAPTRFVTVASPGGRMAQIAALDPTSFVGRLQVWEFVCGECRRPQLALGCAGPAGPEYHIIPSVGGGLSTPNTPAAVRYNLELASRCESAAASPAALAMYRAALEHVLLEQGFDRRMLGPKIEQLESAIKGGKAPRWALDLDPEYLIVIKDLGNWSLHADGPDVQQHMELDPTLLREIRAVFVLLLQEVYEIPLQREARLAGLKDVRDSLKKKSPAPTPRTQSS